MKDVNGRKLICFDLAVISLIVCIGVFWYTLKLNKAANHFEATHKSKPKQIDTDSVYIRFRK